MVQAPRAPSAGRDGGPPTHRRNGRARIGRRRRRRIPQRHRARSGPRGRKAYAPWHGGRPNPARVGTQARAPPAGAGLKRVPSPGGAPRSARDRQSRPLGSAEPSLEPETPTATTSHLLSTLAIGASLACAGAPPVPTRPYEFRGAVEGGAGKLSVSDGGQGEPAVLFVHGLGSELEAWRPELDRLRATRRVVAYDQRGHGASEKARDGVYTIERPGRRPRPGGEGPRPAPGGAGGPQHVGDGHHHLGRRPPGPGGRAGLRGRRRRLPRRGSGRARRPSSRGTRPS